MIIYPKGFISLFSFLINSAFDLLFIHLCFSLLKDGIIESIESKEHDWCIGVQWHPEFLITKSDVKLIKSFINNSKKNENC